MRCTACKSPLVHRDAINVNGNYNHNCSGHDLPCPARKEILYGCHAAVRPNDIYIAEYHLPFFAGGEWFLLVGEGVVTGMGSSTLYRYMTYKNIPSRDLMHGEPFKALYCNEWFNDDALNLFRHMLKTSGYEKRVKYFFMR